MESTSVYQGRWFFAMFFSLNGSKMVIGELIDSTGPTYSGKSIWIFHWMEIGAIHEGLEFMNRAAGTSQQRVKVEDVAKVFKDCWRFSNLL